MGKLSLDSASGLLYYGVLAGAMAAGAGLVAIFVHEVIGHGLVALIMGGQINTIYISPFFGYANTILPSDFATVADFLAGPLVAAAAGFAVILFYPRLMDWPFQAKLFLLFAAAILESNFLYGMLSPFIGWGDTYNVVVMTGADPLLVGLLFLPFAVVTFYLLGRRFLGLFAPYMRIEDSFESRIVALFKSAILPVLFLDVILFVYGPIVYNLPYTVFGALNAAMDIVFIIPSLVLASMTKMKPEPITNSAKSAFSGIVRYAVASLLAMVLMALLFALLNIPSISTAVAL